MMTAGAQQTSKNDASGFKAKGGTADILNAVNMEVTQEALQSNVMGELEQTAKEEHKNQIAEWEAAQKKAHIAEKDDFDEDEFDDEDFMEQMKAKRLNDLQNKCVPLPIQPSPNADMHGRASRLLRSAALTARRLSAPCRYALEKQFYAQGHGEYREITEEEFLKEVCGSQWVVVHFYHREFFRCKIADKHLKILAQKHLSCKWLTLDAEKAPFFITKLGIQMLPTVIVFKDGVVSDQFAGFDEMGGKDDFRTEVMEHWFSKTGCVKMKKADVKKAEQGSDESDADSDED